MIMEKAVTDTPMTRIDTITPIRVLAWAYGLNGDTITSASLHAEADALIAELDKADE